MTIEQSIMALGDYSELTVALLTDIVLDHMREATIRNEDEPGITRTRLDVIDGIAAVIDRKPQQFGDEFEERVWEALGFTPDPFNRPCDYDLP